MVSCLRYANVHSESALHLSAVEMEEGWSNVSFLLHLGHHRWHHCHIHPLESTCNGLFHSLVNFFLELNGLNRRVFNSSETNGYYYYGYYVTMWTRWPPYLVGIALGWLLHITRNKQIKMTKVNNLLLFLKIKFKSIFCLGCGSSRLDCCFRGSTRRVVRNGRVYRPGDCTGHKRCCSGLLRFSTSIGVVVGYKLGDFHLHKRLWRYKQLNKNFKNENYKISN